jgi:hypothetical protein
VSKIYELELRKPPLFAKSFDDSVDFSLGGELVLSATLDVVFQLPKLGATGSQSSNNLSSLASKIKCDHFVIGRRKIREAFGWVAIVVGYGEVSNPGD